MKEEILNGIAASNGRATGKVRVIRPGTNRSEFQDDEVLVTRLTDPSMIMMMSKACAIVCDVGGMVSHPAIVSREMGTPCVVATKKATEVLKDGMMVEVDGSNGKIYLMEDE